MFLPGQFHFIFSISRFNNPEGLKYLVQLLGKHQNTCKWGWGWHPPPVSRYLALRRQRSPPVWRSKGQPISKDQACWRQLWKQYSVKSICIFFGIFMTTHKARDQFVICDHLVVVNFVAAIHWRLLIDQKIIWNWFLVCLQLISILEWFLFNLELQVPRAQSSVPPLYREQLNKYSNFKGCQKDFNFWFLFTKRPNAGSSRLKEGSITPMSSEGAPNSRWQT